MKSFIYLCFSVSLVFNIVYEYCAAQVQAPMKCSDEDKDNITDAKLLTLGKAIVPNLMWKDKKKGEAGKIGIIGGSTEYTGAPYFAAISALKVGADLVYVITTETAAPVIKSYSPDLIVYPFLEPKYINKINELIPKMDVLIIGPGLGREEATLSLLYSIIETCKKLLKPLVIDADGLYAISKNITIIEDYPSPGVILTPNHHEAKRLSEAVAGDPHHWYNTERCGEYVSFLIKGAEDEFYSKQPNFQWKLSRGGSGRRCGGQGDILAGALGTFYNWALHAILCSNDKSVQLAQSAAAYAAARFTRICNFKAFGQHGRSMTASDMLVEIHPAFEEFMEMCKEAAESGWRFFYD